jgi:hypothetical protein
MRSDVVSITSQQSSGRIRQDDVGHIGSALIRVERSLHNQRTPRP